MILRARRAVVVNKNPVISRSIRRVLGAPPVGVSLHQGNRGEMHSFHRTENTRQKIAKKFATELSRSFPLGLESGEPMNQQRMTMAVFIAVLAVVLITLFTMTASKDTKQTIGESIPHGTSEKPVSK
jgi:hypothetical protein